MKTLLEICAGSLSSALAAQEGGADRIELCSALPLGGLTPSHVSIEMAKKLLKIPVFVLVRPREGNFVYSPMEIALLCTDIRVAIHLGADGIVCGALDSAGNIDLKAMESILKASHGVSFTFHRAFDLCKDPIESFRILMNLGIDTLLTSGLSSTALEGVKVIQNLVALSKTERDAGILVMPGSGINSSNISHLVSQTGVTEIHTSAKKKMEGNYFQTDVNEVRSCRMALDSIDSTLFNK